MESMTLTRGEDEKTLDYFDRFTPHYNPARFQFGIDYLKQHASAAHSLLDIGCGDGATLSLLKENTPLVDLWGLDISGNYLAKAERLLSCRTIEGSILDNDLVAKHAGRFDFCTLGAVVHHLIGATRKESLEFARQCLRNSVELLKPGGSLIIFEPTYSPGWMMSVAFWIKKGFSRYSNSRIELFKSWANLGQPVVSYYTREQLTQMAKALPEANVHMNEVNDRYTLGGFIKRQGVGMILRRKATQG